MTAAQTITKAIQDAANNQPKPYDTMAVVKRVEGSTVWVHIPGGIDETPVQRTIDAKVGDNVQIRVSGGSAWLVGNTTAPPTDDTVAKKAEAKADDAGWVASEAVQTAENATRIAGNTNQYFWHTETGADTGAHITEIPRGDFLADPDNGGGNLLARSNGIAVRDGLAELATFGSGGVAIGQDENGSSRSELTSSGMKITRKNGGVVYTLADIGYDNGYDSSGQLVQNPYYSFGRRLGNIGNYSLVQGMNVQATAYVSRAQGESSKATAGMAVAEGYRCTASGARSHAFGQDAVSSGYNSFAQGHKVTAGYINQTAIGRRNANDQLNAFEIGNGEEFGDTYSNAFAVDWDGKIKTPQIQAGSVGATSVAANSYTDVAVTFSEAMSAAPTVVCGLVSTSTAGAIGSISVAVVSASTTGFTARLFNAGSTGRSPGFYWLAMNI